MEPIVERKQTGARCLRSCEFDKKLETKAIFHKFSKDWWHVSLLARKNMYFTYSFIWRVLLPTNLLVQSNDELTVYLDEDEDKTRWLCVWNVSFFLYFIFKYNNGMKAWTLLWEIFFLSSVAALCSLSWLWTLLSRSVNRQLVLVVVKCHKISDPK